MIKPGRLQTYTDTELALMILLGCYGNGAARKNALGSRYAAAQALVEKILKTGAVPDGSGADYDSIQKAVYDVFYDSINDITNEVMEKLK